ncbi:MAG: hypothetical protein WB973_07300 [Thermoanaerobaculia bacterium]
MPLSNRKGFFITAFGDRANFVHHALKEQAEKLGARLEKLDAAGGLPDTPPKPDNRLDLQARLSRMLRDSDFVVVDLSPPDLGSSGAFNPNVMFELGRALELKRPIYSICDARVLQKGLPFDIAPLETITYDLRPDGLVKLAKSFASWLKDGQLSRHALAHKHILDLVELRDQFASWEESTLHRFGPVINVVIGRLKDYADLITRANKTKTGEVAFEPLRRQDMIEAVFCSTLSAMQETDEYDTVSTLEFWREIQGGGARDNRNNIDSLLNATKKALDRGVKNRRLFLVQGWNLHGAAPGEALIEGHESLRAKYPDKYTLGYYVVSKENYLSLRQRQHVGVCRVRSQGVDFVLQPSYSIREGDGGERLIKLNYVLGTEAADKFAHGIETLWTSDTQGKRFPSWAKVLEAFT